MITVSVASKFVRITNERFVSLGWLVHVRNNRVDLYHLHILEMCCSFGKFVSYAESKRATASSSVNDFKSVLSGRLILLNPLRR